MERNDVIATLNNLIETSRDGEEGFRQCADTVKSVSLKTFFEQKAERCREAVTQLQHIIREMGGDPETGGSASDAMHRFWVGLRGSISTMSDHAILDECERGEDVAKRSYEKALSRDLPGDVRRVVERQYAEVKMNHDKVREMRNATA
ncbi:MAG: PA2169 family four-helix-bundle protein [Alphaproteobacteria bacterium]